MNCPLKYYSVRVNFSLFRDGINCIAGCILMTDNFVLMIVVFLTCDMQIKQFCVETDSNLYKDKFRRHFILILVIKYLRMWPIS